MKNLPSSALRSASLIALMCTGCANTGQDSQSASVKAAATPTSTPTPKPTSKPKSKKKGQIMTNRVPKQIPINHDDYQAKHIGKLGDGRQFFLTTPFVPAIGNNPGRAFLVLYLFDKKGKLLEARIEDLGVRQNSILPGNVDESHAADLLESWLAKLDIDSFCDIKVAPFQTERFGIEFGLIPRPPEDKDDPWTVELQPGDYMAFYPPWDGDYDT